MKHEHDYSIVTEVGVFGDLNIDDPTVTPVRKKGSTADCSEQEIDALIQESIAQNKNICF